jgi:DNA-binding MarR family transcriptional regulator
MERSKAESFTAYLEAVQRSERAARAVPTTSGGGTALTLLAALAVDGQGVMLLSDLQEASGMTFLDFSQALKRLVDAGYLTVKGEPGRESVVVTKLGAEVADLARPVQ